MEQTMMAHQRQFEERKEMVLKALMSDEKDKSRKGGVDAPIADLIAHINSHPSFLTTSSCSGRVSIFLEQSSTLLTSDPYHGVENGVSGARAKVKQGGSWIYVSHEAAEIDEVLMSVRKLYEVTEKNKSEGLLVFRFEPFIVALECSSLAAAQRLVACAMASGCRESGISSVGKRIIVAVRSSIRLEVPIGTKGALLVSEEYLAFLVALANEKFVLNKQRIDRFMATFMDHFGDEFGRAPSTMDIPMMAARGPKAEPRRRKPMDSHLRDKLLSSIEARQSKILMRINPLETETGLI